MYERVKTLKQQKKFEETWEYICSKSGWVNDPYDESGVRYNILLQKRFSFITKKVIGTIEFIPYDPSNPHSTVEGPTRSTFSIYEDIIKFQARTWEIDKLCIDEDYQRKGYFQSFMEVFYDHAVTYSPKYYLALIEKKFYRMLKISYGLAIEQRGEALPGKDTALIPIVFDIDKLMNNATVIDSYLKASKIKSYQKSSSI